ncbi:hypothetical protein, partial [Paenibacillus sp. 22594]|uniref:hypothetical protein n=1 Tax=Paenibacillus sp. 22594 TaxID=3453947 RepID=UPI003F8302B0
NSPNWYLERAIAHFETSDENKIFSILDLTFVKSHSLVVQFSKIKLVVGVDYLVTSNSYNISCSAE